jgi:urease accessory protein
MTDLTALIALLQFADGLFPSGGFAHSFGLETYAQERTVRDAAGLRELIGTHLEGSAGPADAVAAALAACAGQASDLDACIEFDRALDAMKTVPELRAASRQMGRQTARAAAVTLGGARETHGGARATPGRARAIARDAGMMVGGHETTLDDETFAGRLAAAIDDELTPGHHAVIFGAVTGRCGASPEMAAAAFLQSTAALLVGAGLRLLQIGQLDGQRVLASMREPIARLARRAAAAGVDDMWSFTPGLEIAGVRHADLEGRLFRS